MQYRRIGKSGLQVSEIAYGSWLTFTSQVELDGAKEIIRKAFELGINYIDTADAYAGGGAEELLGQVLPEYDRRDYIVASKLFWPQSDAPTNRGLSRKHIVDSVAISLKRMKLDYMDILYCHRYDPETELEETVRGMNDVIDQGKVTYWGTSEWTAGQIAEAVRICDEKGWHKPIVNQPLYNMLNRYIEEEVLPTCVESGMGTANFSPLAQGVLTGKYSGGRIPDGSRGSNNSQNMWMKDQISDIELLDKVESMKPIAEKYGLNLAQLSLAWILQNPGISSVITGATTAAQLESNVKASGVKLEAEDKAAMDALFPAAGPE